MPLVPLPADQSPAARLSACDVVWTTPSTDASGSMPIGNGEVALNVWVEDKSGDLLFLIARSDALSEICRILKLGRIRVHLSPPLAVSSGFRQQLHLRDGTIEIRSGGTRLLVFVDSDRDVIHVLGSSRNPVSVSATVESWRTEPRTLPRAEQGSAWAMQGAPFPLIESADQFSTLGGGVCWFHRNETSAAQALWENQSLVGLPGCFDPLIHRTFGGFLTGSNLDEGAGFTIDGNTLRSSPLHRFDLSIATASFQARDAQAWRSRVKRIAENSPAAAALARTQGWWHGFWDRSWVFVDNDYTGEPIPANRHPLRKGVDSNGGNRFPGTIEHWLWAADGAPVRDDSVSDLTVAHDLHLGATITPTKLEPGRIFDKLTAGGNDGFLFDTYPGDGLRLIVGDMTLVAPHCLRQGEPASVWATYAVATGEAAVYKDGARVAYRPPQSGSPVTRGYALQRYTQACEGRGAYPIKFNGGSFTVEPSAMGEPFNPDWRRWGDSHWWQNVRHMYHPMLEQGDIEMMEPLFRLYEAARPLAESRSNSYHGSEGAYFPETMTVLGTYAGGDYGWDRRGHQPQDVLCPWWQYAWNQGPELVALMLDRWDYTRDEKFLKARVLPMAESVLRYFDTRFAKKDGKVVLEPTQVVETYWEGVVNDMPSTAGLRAITERLTELPAKFVPERQRQLFAKMRAACPNLPLEVRKGVRQLAPAQRYVPKTSNVENGELYAVWPFRLVRLGRAELLPEAKSAYANRLNRLDVGWGYDGNVAALLGMSEEASRILKVKCANSNPKYRWPATWGPNFDWLPDQNHGGNLLNTANLMLLQADPIEEGGAIRVLPAWPKGWDTDFKLHAPADTQVRCRVKGGVIVELQVTPPERRKDVVLGEGWQIAAKR